MARPRNAEGKFEPNETSVSEWPVGEAVLAEVQSFDMSAEMRQIAREEIASLCGLVLNRTKDRAGMVVRAELASIFGEALNDFTTENEPGAA